MVSYHVGHFKIDRICDNTSVVCYKVNNLIKCSSFNFLKFEITQWIHGKIKQNATLLNFLDEKLLSFVWWCI